VTALAPTLQAYFTTRLVGEFGVSTHTVTAYRDTWRLLLRFIAATRRTPPQDLDLADLDAHVISAFLTHLETDRHNAVPTRNARLAAIHSFYAFAAYAHPEHGATISQILAIPAKRHPRTDVSYLTATQVSALLAAPDRATRAGRRDHALIQLAVTAGLRVSELTALRTTDIPAGGFLFPTRTGTRMSTDAVAARLALHAHTAATSCPSINAGTITPHVLRHTAAMRLLTAGIDTTVIALWLGHESVETTQIYLHADITTKEKALARTTPTGTRPGRYTITDDTLLAFLNSL
jgi:integrase/recombinase XerD